jgi:transposase
MDIDRVEAVRTSIQTLVKHLETEMETMRQAIGDHFGRHRDLKKQQDLLVSIPGIAETTATTFLAEIQSWQMFENARQLVAFVSLTPRTRLLGTSVRGKPQISRIGSNRLTTLRISSKSFQSNSPSREDPQPVVGQVRAGV